MNKIKNLREENDIKQEELSKILNVQRSNVSKYETGKILLREDQIVNLCKFFNVSADYLLGLSSIKDSTNTEKELFDLLGINKQKYANLSLKSQEQIKKFIEFVEGQDNK